MVKSGDRLDRKTLTSKEKILIHVKESLPLRDPLDAPFALTQQGIAEAVGMRSSHVSRAVKALKKDGYLSEIPARVRGELRKRRAYLLTERGNSSAQKIKNGIVWRKLVVKDSKGRIREVELSRIGELITKPLPTMKIISLMDSYGILDIKKVEEREEERPLVNFWAEKPKEEPFHGRQREMDLVKGWMDSEKKVLAITGDRGIGKTALAFRVISSYERKKNTFWYSFRQWDSFDNIIAALASFLAQMGRTEPQRCLSSEKPNIREIETALQSALDESNSLLAFDNYIEQREIERFLFLLLEIAGRIDVKILVTCDNGLPKKRELLAGGLLEEMELSGLDEESSKKLLPKMKRKEFNRIYKLTEGHPLSLKLIGSGILDKDIDQKAYTSEELDLIRHLKLLEKSES